MMNNWTPPPLESFKRLQVTEGLAIDTQRWRLAHNYHRKRQNYYYNSLHLPGIVDGLGVSLIKDNDQIDRKYKDGRGIVIKPGIAIDGQGNFIIVEQPNYYRIRSHVARETTIYLLISYQDPDQLEIVEQNQSEIVTEAFRIDEKYSPPSQNEIELCRIKLQPGEVILKTALDVFNPQINELDLTKRLQAQLRPQTFVTIGISQNNYSSRHNLNGLLQSVSAIYPHWAGQTPVKPCLISPPSREIVDYYVEQIISLDLIYLTQIEFDQFYLEPHAVMVLEKYLNSGGLLLIEAATAATNLGELARVKQELQQMIADLKQNQIFTHLQEELEQEKQNVIQALKERIATISEKVSLFAHRLGADLQPLEDLHDHPLWKQPFLFHQLPTLQGEETISIWLGGGIIFVIGELSLAWGSNLELALSRDHIRNAQQFAINLLNFAASRRKLIQLS
jgi:hypothetical protein